MKISKRKPSTVDYLAAELSKKTGTKFTVTGGRMPPPLSYGRPIPNALGDMRYQLRAERGIHSYTFQAMRPMTLGEMRRWLASINDMVGMGFIPVDKREVS